MTAARSRHSALPFSFYPASSQKRRSKFVFCCSATKRRTGGETASFFAMGASIALGVWIQNSHQGAPRGWRPCRAEGPHERLHLVEVERACLLEKPGRLLRKTSSLGRVGVLPKRLQRACRRAVLLDEVLVQVPGKDAAQLGEVVRFHCRHSGYDVRT